MGFPMASNLFKKLQPLQFIVYDSSQNTVEKFQREHGSCLAAKNPFELAKKAQIIVTMLPASPHVKAVYLGENGLLNGLSKNTMVIDSSTIDPSTTKEISKILKTVGVDLLDAPVSGGTLGAQAGTLTFMVGSRNMELFEKSKEILCHMGKNITYCGSEGNGQVAKICNNMLLGISMMGAAETMNLGVRMGMDPTLLAGIINTSSGRCWSTDTYNPCPGVFPNTPASRDYTGGFGVALMKKDMGLAVNAAAETKSTAILAGVAHQVYTQISETKGFENKDFSSVYKWLNNK